MKFIKSFFISLIILILFACSNNTNSKLSYTDVDTVKNVIKNMEVDVSWTREIEGDRLVEKTEPKDRVSENVSFDKNAILILPDVRTPVYPSLETFGSLNSSKLTDVQSATISGVCSAISKNIYSGPENFFNNKYQFNLFFFRKELIEKWTENFNQDFPVRAEDFVSKNEEPLQEGEEPPELVLPDPIFNNWFIGEPFTGEGVSEIPVRFFSPNGTVDVTIYMNPNAENSIFQITINRWGKQ